MKDAFAACLETQIAPPHAMSQKYLFNEKITPVSTIK
jgi:hypothetical protein